MQSSEKSAAYSDATHRVASFNTVQSFWKLWNHMPQPSELLEQKRMVREQPDGLHVIDAIMIFRENIRPEWEDKMNESGGHFQFQLKPNVGGGQVDAILGVHGMTSCAGTTRQYVCFPAPVGISASLSSLSLGGARCKRSTDDANASGVRVTR